MNFSLSFTEHDLHLIIAKDQDLLQSFRHAMGAHQYAQCWLPVSSAAETFGESQKRLNTRYQGYCEMYLWNFAKILRSKNHMSFSQMAMKACFPNADHQEEFCENLAILYIRMRKSLCEESKDTEKPISRDVIFR